MRFTTHAVVTEYWKPGYDWTKMMLESISTDLADGDIVVVSEKAMAVARGRIIDESKARPSLLARFLTIYWMRVAWALLLGRLCHMKKVNLNHLRAYPLDEGAKHKQVCLDQVGLLQSLQPFSEGGIDTTNLPYSLASLPLKHPQILAEQIRETISRRLRKNVTVAIVDSDKTYSCFGIHLASRFTDVRGIVTLGFFAYLIGRSLRWKARSTPLAWAGREVRPEFALRVAGLANKARGHGAGRTTWEMADRFGVGITQVDWGMLQSIRHKPIVVVRLTQRGSGPVSAQYYD